MTGTIPSGLSACTGLTSLSATSFLTGSSPPPLSTLSKSYLYGQIPPQLSTLVNLVELSALFRLDRNSPLPGTSQMTWVLTL